VLDVVLDDERIGAGGRHILEDQTVGRGLALDVVGLILVEVAVLPGRSSAGRRRAGAAVGALVEIA